MKKTLAILSLSIAAGGVALAGPTTVAATGKNPIPAAPPIQKQGFYVGVNGGPAWFQSITAERHGVSVDADFETGGGFIGALGYRWANGFQLELNSGFYTASVDDAQVRYNGRNLDLGIDGDLEQVPIMVTGIYRFFNNEPFSVYVGFGVGTIYTSLELDSVGQIQTEAEDSSWDFGLQALGGVSYAVTDNLDANLGYRYIRAFSDGDDDINGHVLEAGLTLRF